jgi:diadenosine tetraphosphate (Ap4A) HIT family hydrolase
VTTNNCLLCQGAAGDAQLSRVQVWEDRLWRLTTTTDGPVPGFSYLEPKRHIPHITDLDGPEALTFGGVLAKVSEVLRTESGADLVWLYVFGGGIPHLHVHLAPHRPDDALNSQMLRGEIEQRPLPSGATRLVAKDFPDAPEQEHRALIERLRQRLG